MAEGCEFVNWRDVDVLRAYNLPPEATMPGGAGSGGASAVPQASMGGPLPPPGAGGGFLSRFGGAVGFLNFLQLQQQGINQPIPLGAIGAVPAMWAPGEWERIQRRAEAERSGVGGAQPRIAVQEGRRLCPLRFPKVSPSAEVETRMKEYCERVGEQLSPFGSTGYSDREWNEFWLLSFTTPRSIRLARQLLWLLKGLVKVKTGTLGTTVSYQR